MFGAKEAMALRLMILIVAEEGPRVHRVAIHKRVNIIQTGHIYRVQEEIVRVEMLIGRVTIMALTVGAHMAMLYVIKPDNAHV